jgi:hypothetical protein
MEVDRKRKTGSQKEAFDYAIKKISIVGLDSETLRQIQQLPYPIQRLIAGEAQAMMGRIEKGKPPPELESISCDCRFFHHYMLPCRHMLHQQCFGSTQSKLLTAGAWMVFHHMFEENGILVYQSRELIEIPIQDQTEEQRGTEIRRLKVAEIMERVRDRFWAVENTGDAEASTAFIANLRTTLTNIIDPEG